MKLGIFAKTFAVDSIESNLDAVRAHGYDCTQYNLVCAGLPTLPDAIEPALCRRIQSAHGQRGLTMAAISGTFNIIDPDCGRLEANMRRFGVLAEAAPALGTRTITLCTGSRDPEDMWRAHPENNTPSAWEDMVRAIRRIVGLASQHGVTVCVEPELNNVVNTAAKARKLLEEVGSPCLKVVLDGANLYQRDAAHDMYGILDEAFEDLGAYVVLAHAKDFDDGEGEGVAAAAGHLDYDYYLRKLVDKGFDGPLIVHGIRASQAAWCARFIREQLDRLLKTPN